MHGISDTVRAELATAVEKIRNNIERAGERASGKTQASLRSEVRTDGDAIVDGAVFGRQAFFTLERGRRGGRIPRNMYSIIRQWIIDKGINVTPIPYVRQPSERWQPKYTPEERGLQSLAGAITHKIKTEGTSLFRHGGRSDIYTPVFDEVEQNLSASINSILALEIDNINKQWSQSK